MSGRFTTRLTQTFGEAAPEWMQVLAEIADSKGHVDTAKRCGISSTAIYNICADSYGAKTDNVELKVRAALMGERVDCPELGDLPAANCQRWQMKPLTPSNRMSIRMHRACRNGCAYSRLRERPS